MPENCVCHVDLIRKMVGDMGRHFYKYKVLNNIKVK